jgi:hypothetical protein
MADARLGQWNIVRCAEAFGFTDPKAFFLSGANDRRLG